MTATAERMREALDSAWMTRLFKVIAIVSLLLALLTGVKQYQLASCLATYSDASNAWQRARSEATAQDRKATDDMVDAFANARGLAPAQARLAVERALSDYQRARAFTDGARSTSPIPEPPSAQC